jgi:predicted transcriptional regulator
MILFNKRNDKNIVITLVAQRKEHIMAKMLEVCKNGATKTKLIHELSMTYRRVRRIMAELVDRRFLRFIVSQEVYITTHRGHIFLDKLKKENAYSQNNNSVLTIKKARK